MQTQFSALAHASVLQLRDVIRRATALHAAPVEERCEKEFLSGVEVSDSTWSDWEETRFDVRSVHA